MMVVDSSCLEDVGKHSPDVVLGENGEDLFQELWSVVHVVCEGLGHLHLSRYHQFHQLRDGPNLLLGSSTATATV